MHFVTNPEIEVLPPYLSNPSWFPSPLGRFRANGPRESSVWNSLVSVMNTGTATLSSKVNITALTLVGGQPLSDYDTLVQKISAAVNLAQGI